MLTIERLQGRVADRVAIKDPRVRPGDPAEFTRGCGSGDTIPQGDLYIMAIDAVPESLGYIAVEAASDKDRQLVPGNTVGARHCLKSLESCQLFRRADWGRDDLEGDEQFLGPVLVCHSNTVVLHPTHGDVMIPSGFTVITGYQPEQDLIEQRERRNAD